MDIRSSIHGVIGERSYRPPPGFIPAADGPDGEDLRPTPAAVIDAASLAGVRLALLYQDADGARSRRVVQVKSIQVSGEIRYLCGHCELRQCLRTFRIDRIVEIVDMRTGEIADDPLAYLAPLMRLARPVKPPRRRAATDGVLAESIHGLIVLVYFANSDGEMHPAERDILWDYLAWNKDRCSIKGGVARAPVDALMRTMFPTGEQFADALHALVTGGAFHAQFVLDRVAEIIDADGELDEEEVRRWQQLSELLNETGLLT